MDFTEKYRIIHMGKPILKFCERFDEMSNIWNFTLHSHPYIELMFFLEGTDSIELADMRLSVSLFDTVIYPANCLHQEALAPGLHREIICLWIDLPDLRLDEPLQIQDRDGRLGTLFKTVHEYSKSKNQIPYMMEHLLKVLLLQALQLVFTGEGLPRISKSVQYIHSHFTQRISLEALAELENVSVSYLSRRFHKQMDMTIIEYVNRLRIEMSKNLLVTTDKDMLEISYQVGYESPNYFYRVFRRFCSESPAAFRRRCKRNASFH
ncbi:helix-turn-helix domain-containing protein [Parasphaerochaeta coccoides]|uniref:Transcriptional regulator, AraC family n=1 Tax=Parasphaerochaeta coccoides (strain ATCC BAA-1237 / DSM 17374 / SPN1) TaxID=760011 RepID=F4GJ53_PARC1|nr:AraC family transcriptional regulator [Parasphaerochaeta coccoides]AEC01348.1 transcriptional regulator, AraC family [Parasphaerochaeta coccoides DSM 17374]